MASNVPSEAPISPALLLALASTPEAAACSCANLGRLSATACRGAARAFGGTVTGYDWPLAYEMGAVEVHLEVDTVWAGEVPAALTATTGLGGGDCGFHPATGDRFVICDDHPGAGQPRLHSCRPDAFGAEARALATDLGPGGAPVGGLAGRVRAWTHPETLAYRAFTQATLAVPLLALGVGAALGTLVRRLRSPGTVPPVRPLVALAALLVPILAARLLLRLLVLDDWERAQLAGPGGLAIATLVALVVGYAGQRAPARFGAPTRAATPVGALAAAVVATTLTLAAAFTPFRAPLQPAGVLACSEARARAWLATLPDGNGPLYDGERSAFLAAVEAANRRAPAACADWGLRRLRAVVYDGRPCARFSDGEGALWTVCRDNPSLLGPAWELPW